MIHILCKRCKGWLPRKRGKHAYTYSVFEARINESGTKQIRCFCGRWTHDPRGSRFYGTREQIKAFEARADKWLELNKEQILNEQKQRNIALWKLEHGYAENDSPNSMTREEIIATLLNKDKLRKELSQEYFKEFGENYQGNIVEDVILDNRSRLNLISQVGNTKY